jgi:hypothetical protein
MESALGPKGLCSMEVILRKLEELLPFKELHSLILIRAQSCLNIKLKHQIDQHLNMNPELKSELDKLPNLRTAFLEGLFGEWL